MELIYEFLWSWYHEEVLFSLYLWRVRNVRCLSRYRNVCQGPAFSKTRVFRNIPSRTWSNTFFKRANASAPSWLLRSSENFGWVFAYSIRNFSAVKMNHLHRGNTNHACLSSYCTGCSLTTFSCINDGRAHKNEFRHMPFFKEKHSTDGSRLRRMGVF